MIEYRNLDASVHYNALQKCARGKRARFDAVHVSEYDIPFVSGLRYNYAARLLSEEELQLLQALANEMQLIDKYHALTGGEYSNRSEGRMVLHHLLRGALHTDAVVDREGKQMSSFYAKEQARFVKCAERIRSGTLRSNCGRRFDAVVQVGIGGSDLGPRALYEALRTWADGEKITHIPAYFISNVDPDDGLSVLAQVDPRSTLFIIVSKSGGTIETLTNTELISSFLKSVGIEDPKRHMIVVTAAGSPLAIDNSYLERFFIDDHIGGRYSSSGAVGGVVLSIALGPSVFTSLLDGAHAADKSAQEPNPLRNPVVLDALCGVYERTFLGYPAYALLPYAQGLHRFPAHIQQLDMESNGKSVNCFGAPIVYDSGAIVFGEPGTNGQHSFYQFLHQGSTIVPSIFVSFTHPQRVVNAIANAGERAVNADAQGEKWTASADGRAAAHASKHMRDADRRASMGDERAASASEHTARSAHDVDNALSTLQKRSSQILRANVVAQIVAFARGDANDNANKHFDGGRPSALLYGKRLTPFTLGALLSFFENRVMFQGFLWNVNSFDQEGVQLGKRLAERALKTGNEHVAADGTHIAKSDNDRALAKYQQLYND